jgi:dipeptidyl aminopeptidase/acylaminoacyl peptidase
MGPALNLSKYSLKNPFNGDDASKPARYFSEIARAGTAPATPVERQMLDGVANERREGGAFEAEDVLAFRVVADIDLSADGRWLLYTLREIDADSDQYFSNHWLISTDGGSARQLTFGRDVNASARFSPDGTRVAFLSNRGGGPAQLYVLPLAGGEAAPITRLKGGAGEPVWSPDGSRIAFAGTVPAEAPPHAPRVVRKLYYKAEGSGFLLNSTTQIFVVPAGGGEPTQLTEGDASATQPSWSPGGDRLAFCRMRGAPKESHRSDIWMLSTAGGPATQLTSRCAHCMAPAWSPDGKWIAFHGAAREGESRQQVWLAEPSPDRERRVTDEDEEVASFPLGVTKPPFWNESSSEVTVVLVSASQSGAARVSLDGSVRRAVSGERQVTMLAASAAARRLCYAWSDPRLCGLLSTAGWDGHDDRLLLNVNAEWARTRRWPRAHFRDFSGSDGHGNHGLLMTPEGTGPWPLLVDVHGGPHAYVELGFPYHPYWYVLVSRGWAVLSLNPAGSASYGKEFAGRLRGRWGEVDLPEQLAGVDGLVNEGVADDSRVAIAGKSYGGYLAAWAIGKTKRFCAAVCSAGVTNLESHYGTSDTGYFVDPQNMGGEVGEVLERYHRLSPIHHAAGAETPTLILHGEDDQRCPIGQGEELFTALMRSSQAEVEFVRYPGGGHHLQETGRPSHRVDYHRRIADFVERHAARRSSL